MPSLTKEKLSVLFNPPHAKAGRYLYAALSTTGITPFQVIDYLVSAKPKFDCSLFRLHVDQTVLRITGEEEILNDLFSQFASFSISGKKVHLRWSSDLKTSRRKLYKVKLNGIIDEIHRTSWEKTLGIKLWPETYNNLFLGSFFGDLESVDPILQECLLESNVDRICNIRPINFCAKCVTFTRKKNGQRTCSCSASQSETTQTSTKAPALAPKASYASIVRSTPASKPIF
jgi:hypothetical protein